MKFILFLSVVFFSGISHAEVDLDRAFLGQRGNQFFYDSTVPNLVWVLPVNLEATPNGEFVDLGSRYKMGYVVGLPLKTRLDMTMTYNQPMVEFRAFRATDFQYIPDVIDINEELKPQIIPMGDAGMLGESVPWSISVAKKAKFDPAAKGALFDLFAGHHRFGLGRIHYSFSAIRGGKPYLAETSIGIYTQKYRTYSFEEASLPGPIFNKPDVNNDDTVSDIIYPEIKFDRDSPCWGQHELNVICLKENI